MHNVPVRPPLSAYKTKEILRAKTGQAQAAATGQPFAATLSAVSTRNDTMTVDHFGGSRNVRIVHPYLGNTAWHRVGPEPGMSLIMSTRLDTAEPEGSVYILNTKRTDDPPPAKLRLNNFEAGTDIYRPVEIGEQELSSSGLAQIFMSRRPVLELRGGYVRGWYDQDKLEFGAKAATHRFLLHKQVPNEIGDEFRMGVVTRPEKVTLSFSDADAAQAFTGLDIGNPTGSIDPNEQNPETVSGLDPENRLPSVHPELARKIKLMAKELKTRNITIKVRYGYRSYDEQNRIYEMGRSTPGDPSYPPPGIATDARGGQSMHNFGVAVDINIVTYPTASMSRDAAYRTAGAIGEALNLKWGGRFERYDRVHFELMVGISMNQYREYYAQGNETLTVVFQEVTKRLGAAKPAKTSTNTSTTSSSPSNSQTQLGANQTAASPTTVTQLSSLRSKFVKINSVFAREFMYNLKSGGTSPVYLVDHREGDVIDNNGDAIKGFFGNKLRYRKALYTAASTYFELQIDENGNTFIRYPNDASDGIRMEVPTGDIAVMVSDSGSKVSWDCAGDYSISAQNDVLVESRGSTAKFLGTSVLLGTDSASDPLILGNVYKSAEKQLFQQLGGMEKASGAALSAAVSSLSSSSVALEALTVNPFLTGLPPILDGMMTAISTCLTALQTAAQSKDIAYSTFNSSYDSYLSTVVKTG